MKALRLRLIVYISLFLAVMALGTVGSMIAEGLALGDAVYFTIATVATVGYGDIHPATPAGKVLAVLLIVLGVGTFLGAIGNATEIMLSRREQRSRMEKLNMVIGVFFSELGNRLLALFAAADAQAQRLRQDFQVSGKWTADDWARVEKALDEVEYEVPWDAVGQAELRRLLFGHRDFLVRLLENPVLLEHETFTDVLWAIFHLADELQLADQQDQLAPDHRRHLGVDITRAYGRLARQWLSYMQHLQGRYPYLFALAIRTNPFVSEPSEATQAETRPAPEPKEA
jgi:hypothetical protein